MAEVTADGDIIVGRRRPKNNPLIRRAEVGKPAFHNDLPPLPTDYTFGAPLKRDPEGAGDVMLTWQQHCPPVSKMTYDFGRDFVTLNRKSIADKCVTAKQLSSYRQEHDARIKPKVSAKKPLIAPAAVISDPNHAFGAKSEHSERVADLIQNRWEYEWVAEQKRRCEAVEAARSKERARHVGPNLSSATKRLEAIQRMKAVTPQPHETFTLPQFRNVPSRFSSLGSPQYASPAPQ